MNGWPAVPGLIPLPPILAPGIRLGAPSQPKPDRNPMTDYRDLIPVFDPAAELDLLIDAAERDLIGGRR